jgi:hypothetical protein
VSLCTCGHSDTDGTAKDGLTAVWPSWGDTGRGELRNDAQGRELYF